MISCGIKSIKPLTCLWFRDKLQLLEQIHFYYDMARCQTKDVTD